MAVYGRGMYEGGGNVWGGVNPLVNPILGYPTPTRGTTTPTQPANVNNYTGGMDIMGGGNWMQGGGIGTQGGGIGTDNTWYAPDTSRPPTGGEYYPGGNNPSQPGQQPPVSPPFAGSGMLPQGYMTPAATTALPAGTNLQDFIQQFIMNEAIKYMTDPTTQYSTMAYLGRDNPAVFGAYKDVVPPSPAAPGQPTDQQKMQMLSPNYINQTANALSFDAIKSQLPTSIQTAITQPANQNALQDMQAGTQWMNEFLKTAALGGGFGKHSATRANQKYARQHLNTLNQEAQSAPQSAGKFATLAENILNPVLNKAPGSGILGLNRAAQFPVGTDYRRGESFRNPWAL